MKIMVIGFGQCGGKVADEFTKLNNDFLFARRIETIADVFAVNTDIADLDSLSNIKPDHRHRILIGNRITGSHGVGKINEVGAELAEKDSDKVIDAIRGARHAYEVDAYLLIAGAAGGTGSGSMPIIARTIKNRFKNRPVYCMVVLPFEHEEKTDARTVYNTATCLSATYSVADAVFLIDNQRYIEKDASLVNNMSVINRLIAEPFCDLLRAGEQNNTKHIGVRLLDAGDIIQTLGGWTALGYGKSQTAAIRLPMSLGHSYRRAGTETHKGLQAMDEAVSNLTLECNLEDSASALYLLSAPTREMTMGLVKELGDHMSELLPKAIIRYGDYPTSGNELKITLIVSQLNHVAKIKKYYENITEIIEIQKTREQENESRISEMLTASAAVPSLIRRNGD